MKRRIHTKKVLVAAIGVATVTYAAACLDGNTETSGNLLPPPDAGAVDARTDGPPTDALSEVVTSGNLMPPPPSDASSDADADAPPPPTDAGDGGG